MLNDEPIPISTPQELQVLLEATPIINYLSYSTPSAYIIRL